MGRVGSLLTGPSCPACWPASCVVPCSRPRLLPCLRALPSHVLPRLLFAGFCWTAGTPSLPLPPPSPISFSPFLSLSLPLVLSLSPRFSACFASMASCLHLTSLGRGGCRFAAEAEFSCLSGQLLDPTGRGLCPVAEVIRMGDACAFFISFSDPPSASVSVVLRYLPRALDFGSVIFTIGNGRTCEHVIQTSALTRGPRADARTFRPYS